MLADTETPPAVQMDDEGQTVKKRRIGGRVVTQQSEAQRHLDLIEGPQVDVQDDTRELSHEPYTKQQYVTRTDSEDSADSDANWEEVDITENAAIQPPLNADYSEPEGIEITIGQRDQSESTAKAKKRKPISAFEKRLRLEIHKIHLCCLLTHSFIRNHWCNDDSVQSHLRKTLPSRTISYLNPDEDKSQFQRSRSFMDGLEQACDHFRGRFKTESMGLTKAKWANSPRDLEKFQLPKNSELPIEKEDFVSAAKVLKASRDVGAQIFCALLRSAGVEVRLVSSLQCLSFNSAASMSDSQPEKYAAEYGFNGVQRSSTPEDSACGEEAGQESLRKNKKGIDPEQLTLLAGKHFRQKDLQFLTVAEPRKIRESKFPVFWVEAFNEAVQKWVPIDPLVTQTIAKPSKLEPPAGDPANTLSYVVAFEDDGSARDVTRRYAKAYNAKVRRDRVESTKGGQKWWKRTMKMFRRQHHLDRDQTEDSELASKEAAEPMPKNVQDFKDHPYYALERHLKRNEIIQPRREVGKVGAGKSGGSSQLEPIYRRRDVQVVQSADKWYRIGREIKNGEQPLKRVPARRNRGQTGGLDDAEEDAENPGVGLYAVFQTAVYRPPRVVNGLISKNAYGNLDVYVPSMVPQGGIHIKHPETSRAAKTLGVDYAEAVTGFVFKGRHGTAVTQGAVIAEQYHEAISALIEAFEDERVRTEDERKSLEAMRLWKRFLAGLRIRERIQGYDVEGERDTDDIVKDSDEDEEDQGGGFFPGTAIEDVAEPTARAPQDWTLEGNEDEGEGGFLVNEANAEEAAAHSVSRDRILDDLDNDEGGGFLVSDDHHDEAELQIQEIKNIHPTSQRSKAKSTQCHDQVDPGSSLNWITGFQSSGPSPKAETPPMSSKMPPFISAEPVLPNPYSSLTKGELPEARLLQNLHKSSPAQQRSQESTPTAPHTLEPSITTTSRLSPLLLSTNASFIPVKHEPATEDQSSPTRDTPAPHPSPSPAPAAASDVSSVPHSAVTTAGLSEARASSEEEDKGSLLSEDPDDEDADPEWLA